MAVCVAHLRHEQLTEAHVLLHCVHHKNCKNVKKECEATRTGSALAQECEAPSRAPRCVGHTCSLSPDAQMLVAPEVELQRLYLKLE